MKKLTETNLTFHACGSAGVFTTALVGVFFSAVSGGVAAVKGR